MPTRSHHQGESALVEECAVRSIELLRRNSTPQGILAATPTPEAEARHYTRIFGRDEPSAALDITCNRLLACTLPL